MRLRWQRSPRKKTKPRVFAPAHASAAPCRAHPIGPTFNRVPDTIRPTDDEAISLGQRLISEALFGAIAVSHPETGHPHVTRIAIGQQPDLAPMTLISDLSLHTAALKADPACALLLGEPGPKGDPLTHPRITLSCKARFLADKSLREHYLKSHPKSRLYIDFADFRFVAFEVLSADLNGGFGKAYRLTATDLGLKN